MSSDGTEVAIWIISVAFTLLSTAAFWDQTVSVQNINKAIEVCEANGGLEKLQQDATVYSTVVCQNGAVFTVKAD